MNNFIAYTTYFGERRYLYPATDGGYSLYPYDVTGNFHISGNTVKLWIPEEKKFVNVGDVSPKSV